MRAKVRMGVFGILVCFAISVFAPLPAEAAPSEAATLGNIAGQVRSMADKTEDARQKKTLQNAAEALDAAGEAVSQGNEEEAEKQKKNALKWVVHATRECIDPGDTPGQIAEELRKEGAMDADGVSRLNSLIDALKNAKERKKKADFPVDDDMAIQQLVLALLDLIDSGGWDGWHPQKAIKWYLNAATMCEDVQNMINQLLDYLNSHSDDTGIPDMSNEGVAEAKKMVDELYKMKEAGASPEEIAEMAEKIKKFIDDQGALTGRMRRAKDAEEAKKEEERRVERVVEPAVTTVRFTALDGKTTVNNDFLGEVETIQFVAVDGTEIDRKEVDPTVTAHHDSFDISIGKATRIGTIVLTGTTGIVRLIQDGRGGPSPGFGGIEPKDGTIDIANNRLNETFNVPDNLTDLTVAPQEHTVTVNKADGSVVAAREGQIAVVNPSLTPPSTGMSEVTMTSPSGVTVSGKNPSWGYNISVPEVTATKAWVPVSVEIVGLEPTAKVTLEFLPGPGQEINPPMVTITAAEAVVPTPVAELRTDIPGPQGLNVIVTTE